MSDIKAILVTSEAAPVVIALPPEEDDGGERLAEMQRVLDGRIEALPFPGRDDVTAYIGDESKYEKKPNAAATAIMAPVIFAGDAIHGPMIICGFDAMRGLTLSAPDDLIERFARHSIPSAGSMGRSDGLGG